MLLSSATFLARYTIWRGCLPIAYLTTRSQYIFSHMSTRSRTIEADKEDLNQFVSVCHNLANTCQRYLEKSCARDPLRTIFEPQVFSAQQRLEEKVVPIATHVFTLAKFYDFYYRPLGTVSAPAAVNQQAANVSHPVPSSESTVEQNRPAEEKPKLVELSTNINSSMDTQCQQDPVWHSVRANGCRSFMKLLQISCENLTSELHLHNESLNNRFLAFMRSSPTATVVEKLQAHLNCQHQLTCSLELLYSATKLVESNEKALGENVDQEHPYGQSNLGLFPSVEAVKENLDKYETLLEGFLQIQTEPFYGYCTAFHLSPTLRRVFKQMHSAMAGYLDMRQNGLSSLVLLGPHALPHWLCPQKRASRLVDYTTRLNIHQLREFWLLADEEIVLMSSRVRSPSVNISHDVLLPWHPDGLRIHETMQISPPAPKWMPAKAARRQPWPVAPDEVLDVPSDGSPLSRKTLEGEKGAMKWLSAARVRIISGKNYSGMHWLHHGCGMGTDFVPFTMSNPSISKNAYKRCNSVEDSFLSQQVVDMSSPSNPNSRSLDSSNSTNSNKGKTAAGLLFHCHGGGFIANSPRSHEMYLRPWTHELQVPIVSVDYSHAPQFPFPHAVNECFYSYCWAAKYASSHLGVSSRVGANNMVLVGDSAGGNLVLGVMQRIIKQRLEWERTMNEKRISDGHEIDQENPLPIPTAVVLFYPSCMLSSVPSPSRMLTLVDPLLPTGIVSRCLLVYMGLDEEQVVRDYEAKSKVAKTISGEVHEDPLTMGHQTPIGVESRSGQQSLRAIQRLLPPSDPLLTPLVMPLEVAKRFPPVYIMVGEMDPLLDDGLELAKLLHRAQVPVNVRVFEHLPHGFLNLNLLSDDCKRATREATEVLRTVLHKQSSKVKSSKCI